MRRVNKNTTMRPLVKNKKNVEEFNKDIGKFGGYEYTQEGRISAVMGNSRMSSAIHAQTVFSGMKILDVGCGDGKYTAEFAPLNPLEVRGIDAAEVAVSAARGRMEHDDKFHFSVGSIYDLSEYHSQYDIAVVRGVLHHLENPEKALEEVCKTAQTVIVLEPNGYNPILKVIEKISPYHRQHEEQSYTPFTLRKWSTKNGGTIVNALYLGLVPMFCPDWMAHLCKALEPLVENIPLIRQICCGQYIYNIQTS